MTKKDKTLHVENPNFRIKSQSGLSVATFEPTRELIEIVKIK